MISQEFIRNNPTQSQPLLQCILATPHLAGLLVPNFSPNATPELFVTMYEDMINAPLNQGPDVAFTLLTKVMISLIFASAVSSCNYFLYCLLFDYFDSMMYGFG